MKKVCLWMVLILLGGLMTLSAEDIPNFSRESSEVKNHELPISLNKTDSYPVAVYFSDMERAYRSKEDYIREVTKLYVDFGTREGLTNHLPADVRWKDTEIKEFPHKREGTDRLEVTIYLDIPEEVQNPQDIQSYDFHQAEMNLFRSFATELPQITSFTFYYYNEEKEEWRDVKDFMPDQQFDPEEMEKSKRDREPRTHHASSHGQGRPEGGLTGTAMVFNAGHGFHDHLTQSWTLQRGLNFHNYEDFHTAELLNQFAVPYFYNAGASVWSAREMDQNENMVIVDVEDGEDYPANGLYREEGDWSDSDGAGFQSMQVEDITSYAEGENPFSDGLTRAAFNTGDETSVAEWTPNIPEDGYYNVYVSWHASGNRSDSALYRVNHTGGSTDFYVNQQINGQTWYYIGNFFFRAGTNPDAGSVQLISEDSDGAVISADAVRFGGGLGNVRRTEASNEVSGYPRWEEDAVYNIQFMGSPTEYYYWDTNDHNNPDERRGWSARPRFARYREEEEGLDTLYMAWHTNAFDGSARGYRTYTHGSARDMDVAYRDAVHDRMMHQGLEGPYGDDFFPTQIKHEGNYGENNPNNLGPNVPGFLIEAIFHDNEEDMLLYRNPHFRNFMARSFYHGVVDYLNNRDHGGDHVIKYLPNPPENLRVTNEGGNEVRVEWEEPVSQDPDGTPEEVIAGDEAESYKVYLSRDGFGFDNGREVEDTEHLFTDLEPGELYFVRVTALNSGGESFATETLTFTVWDDTASILIVNGYNRFDKGVVSQRDYPQTREYLYIPEVNLFNYTAQHAQAIVDNDYYGIDSCANEAIINGDINLEDYHTVIWILGQESGDYRTFDNAERNQVQSFLDGGGNLMVSGSEIGWDLDHEGHAQDFFRNTLHAEFISESSDTYTVRGGDNEQSIFYDIDPFDFEDGSSSLMYHPRFTDVYDTSAGSIEALRYDDGTDQGIAGIQYVGDYQVVHLAFPFETIKEESVRADVMGRVLNHFEPTVVESWSLY